jgi:hypothetical protein
VAKANNLVSIRMGFKVSEKTDPVVFFVPGKVTGFAPYAQSEGALQFVNVQYTHRPPEDYLEIIGRMLEANVASARRKDERVLMTPDAIRKIGLARKESTLMIENVPRKSIIRDLSFSGAKVIIVGIAKFLVGKACQLRMDLEEPRETLCIDGNVVRFENVEGRKDLTALAINYDEAKVPMIYKMHLNDYIGQSRKGQPDDDARKDDNVIQPPLADTPKPPESDKQKPPESDKQKSPAIAGAPAVAETGSQKP